MPKHQFPRGAAEIEKSAESRESSGGNFRPFLQNFFWKDGDERFLLFLNPIEDIPKVMLQEVWLSNGRKAHAIARTDPAIGARKDPIQDTWQYKPVERYVAIAVELEADVEEVRGRPRPTGFHVATRTFERKIYDENNEATGETEEVTAPVIGVVVQSASNFFRHVAHKDVKRGPIEKNAVEITRLGGGTDTDYAVEMFDEPVDTANLVDFYDAISYLSEEDLAKLDAIQSDDELVAEIGNILLDKWLDEKADEDYYNEVLDQIDEPARFAKDNKPSGAKRTARQGRGERQARPSQRRSSAASEAAPAEAEGSGESEGGEAKPAPRRRATRTSPVADRLKELRAEGKATA